jgi:flagellar motor switch protein FliN/FliY
VASGPLTQAWLLEEFTARLAAAFEGMTMEAVSIDCEVSDYPAASAPSGGRLLWRQPFAGSPGILWLAAELGAVAAIGGHVLTVAGLSAADIENDPTSVRSTYLEILGQTAGGLGQALSGKLGCEVTPGGGSEAPEITGSIQWSRFNVHLPQGAIEIHAGFDAAFLEPPKPAAAPAPPPTREEAAKSPSGPKSKTFDLLLDVELPVSVSFGRAQIPLKDVLKLTTGSIVELNRSISEPAEVIVNNCVIARGEVVVVEGNFGIRVQQVMSRQDRLRTLY